VTYPGNVTYTRPALTRPEALEVANVLVTQWADQVKNERGYVHDKWQPVDLGQRTEAVLRVAAWLLEPTGPVPSGLLVPPVEEHQHRASCDDSGGNHLCGYR
jgi:hypothetical protein